MTNDQNKLTRQDEDLAAAEFSEEEVRDRHNFGNWPELFGLGLAIVVIWLVFAFTG